MKHNPEILRQWFATLSSSKNVKPTDTGYYRTPQEKKAYYSQLYRRLNLKN